MTSSNGTHEYLSPPEHPDDLGTLGSYRVVSELGKGGMGFVFRAEDKRLKRTVALKVMNKRVAATPHSRARFISEARAMAAVHHDNVATIFEVGEHSGTPFMAMEMLKGETLEEYKLKKERPNYEQIIRFAIETAQGLAAAHAQGIVHRDIKPANIWVEEGSERIKILDFGLALAQTPVDQLSGRGSVVGTPGYLSPEQARSEPLDDRSDLYSLGVVLYEFATGKLPLRSSTVAGQLIAILAHKPQPIREINDRIPQPLADLIHKLLNKEPRNRIRSAAQLVEELKRVEVECESKSEVALAINKLQMGLQEVVSQKDSPILAIDDPMAGGISAGDPFASLPDAPTAAVPLATAPSPLDAAPAAAPAMRPKPASGKAKAPAKQNDLSASLLKYWPIAAGLAVAAIPILVFLYSGSGRQANRVIGPTSTTEQVPDSSPPETDSQRVAAAAPEKSVKQQQSPPQSDRPKDKPDKKGPKKTDKQRQQREPSPPQPSPDSLAANSKTKPRPTPASLTANKTPQPERQPEMSKQSRTPEPAHVTPATPRTPDPIPEPPPPVQVVTISNTEGRGADATVKRGGGIRNTLGLKPSLAIQTRGNMEIQHAYIRFDLAALSLEGQGAEPGGRGNRQQGGGQNKPKERKTGKVALVLHSVDGSANDASIRVYGADNPNSEIWQEEGPLAISWKRSFSEAGLDSLPMLAEVAGAQLQDNVIRITSSELADFVRTTPLSTVTLILAGGKGSQTIQFVSRDGDDNKAPELLVETTGP